jgi:hypothetical protein
VSLARLVITTVVVESTRAAEVASTRAMVYLGALLGLGSPSARSPDSAWAGSTPSAAPFASKRPSPRRADTATSGSRRPGAAGERCRSSSRSRGRRLAKALRRMWMEPSVPICRPRPPGTAGNQAFFARARASDLAALLSSTESARKGSVRTAADDSGRTGLHGTRSAAAPLSKPRSRTGCER